MLSSSIIGIIVVVVVVALVGAATSEKSFRYDHMQNLLFCLPYNVIEPSECPREFLATHLEEWIDNQSFRIIQNPHLYSMKSFLVTFRI